MLPAPVARVAVSCGRLFSKPTSQHQRRVVFQVCGCRVSNKATAPFHQPNLPQEWKQDQKRFNSIVSMSKNPQSAEPTDVSPSKKFKGEGAKYKLTYFNIKWLAEPIRYLFHYVEEDFVDNRVDFGDWDKVKNEYPYGKIPLLEWEGKKLSQSFAIARYLGKQFKLAGADDFEAAKCDEYADVVKDILKEVEGMFHEDDAKKLKIKNNVLDKTMPQLLPKVEEDLKASGGKFLVGSNFTWVDFLLAHYTSLFESFVDPSVLDNYPTIKAHQKNVHNIPQIKDWIAKRPVTEH